MHPVTLYFTDYIDGSVCTCTMTPEPETAKGLSLYREKYARDPSLAMEEADQAPLLAAFCQIHDTITDHIIEKCRDDFSYCTRLKDTACRTLSARQGMDWQELGQQKLEGFQKAAQEGKLDGCFPDFCAFVQFLIRADRPVPTLFQDLLSIQDA